MQNYYGNALTVSDTVRDLYWSWCNSQL